VSASASRDVDLLGTAMCIADQRLLGAATALTVRKAVLCPPATRHRFAVTKAVSEHQRGPGSRLAGLVVLVLAEREVEAAGVCAMAGIGHLLTISWRAMTHPHLLIAMLVSRHASYEIRVADMVDLVFGVVHHRGGSRDRDRFLLGQARENTDRASALELRSAFFETIVYIVAARALRVVAA
jgi:hypothetical protein